VVSEAGGGSVEGSYGWTCVCVDPSLSTVVVAIARLIKVHYEWTKVFHTRSCRSSSDNSGSWRLLIDPCIRIRRIAADIAS
jgi:hypothetical protein